MAKIFVRERRHVGQGAGRPRFAILAVEGADLKIFIPHVRKAELEKLSEAISAEIIYLPRGEQAGEHSEGKNKRHRRRSQED